MIRIPPNIYINNCDNLLYNVFPAFSDDGDGICIGGGKNFGDILGDKLGDGIGDEIGDGVGDGIGGGFGKGGGKNLGDILGDILGDGTGDGNGGTIGEEFSVPNNNDSTNRRIIIT